MLIRNIFIVDENLRIYDMDGSYVEFGADDAIDLLADLKRKHGQLLDIMSRQDARTRKQEHVERTS